MINTYDQTYYSGLKMLQLEQKIDRQYNKTMKALNPI